MTPSRSLPLKAPTPSVSPGRQVATHAHRHPPADNRLMQAAARRAGIRAKLEVGEVDDPEEREAEAIADRVMRTPEGACCASCATGGSCGNETVRRTADGGTMRRSLSPSASSGIRGLAGGGEPLPPRLRGFFEPRLGDDLSSVRLHTGPAAAAAARSISARAFAHGTDIAFGTGQYAPDSPAGQRLLAHELAHVVRGHGGEKVHRSAADDALALLGSAAQGVTGALEKVSALPAAAVDAAAALTGVGDGLPGTADLKGEAGGVIDSITEGALSLAVKAANAIAKRFGGKVERTPRGLEIHLPSVQLFEPATEELSSLALGRFIPLLPIGFTVGPISAQGALALRLGNPTMIGSIGPGRLQNVRLILNPGTGTYGGEAELYVAGAVSESIEAGLEVGLLAEGVIPMEPPIPIVGTIEGGVRAILRGVGKGGLLQRVAVEYRAGDLVVNYLGRLQMGGLIELDLELFLQAMLEERSVCRLIWPVRSLRIKDTAEQYELPFTVSHKEGATGIDVGKITSKEIDVDSIQTAFWHARPPDECMKLNELVRELCNAGKLPPSVCAIPQQVVAGASDLPFPGLEPLGFGPAAPALPATPGQRPIGTEDQPISMEWYKPASEYPDPIHLSFDQWDPTEEWIAYGKDKRGRLPDKSGWIGVTYWPAVGHKVQNLRTQPPRRAQGPFVEALDENGFDWGGYQPDHVVDLQFRSMQQPDPDSLAYKNLWPLDAALNMRAGREMANQVVYMNLPSDPPERAPWPTALYEVKNFLGTDPWFRIINIRLPP